MKIPINPLLLAPLVAGVVRLWGKTLRVTIHGDLDKLLKDNEDGRPQIIALWHGELVPIAMFSYSFAENFCVMISQSKDGDFITRVLESYGAKPIRGSSSRGGVRALLEMKKKITNEKTIAVITTDGPRGPRHKAKDGVFVLAQRAKAKIFPVRIVAKRKKQFVKSWDKAILPLPFSRIHVCIGDPIEVTQEKLDKDVLAKEKERLEQSMRALGKLSE